MAIFYVSFGKHRDVLIEYNREARTRWIFERETGGWTWQYGGLYVCYERITPNWGDSREERPSGTCKGYVNESGPIGRMGDGVDVPEDCGLASTGNCASGVSGRTESSTLERLPVGRSAR